MVLSELLCERLGLFRAIIQRNLLPRLRWTIQVNQPLLLSDPALDNSEKVNRPLLLSDPALDNSEKVNRPLLLSDPSQSPPEIAQEQSLDNQLSWQTTTSRRSVRASRNDVVAPLSIDMCNDVVIQLGAYHN